MYPILVDVAPFAADAVDDDGADTYEVRYMGRQMNEGSGRVGEVRHVVVGERAFARIAVFDGTSG